MRGDAGAEVVPEPARDVDGVALHDEVDLVAGRAADQGVAHHPAHGAHPGRQVGGQAAHQGVRGDPLAAPGG